MVGDDGKTTVGRYLVRRMEQSGLKHVFGVPGDYALIFFDYLEDSSMDVICTCNELNAGYAADAYARLNGIGAACVTYDVGGLSLLNAVVGSYAERVPVLVICGSPRLTEDQHPHLLHHTTGDMNLQHEIYEMATAHSVIITDPKQAPRQIDEAISIVLQKRRPVYVELPMDVVPKQCSAPGPFEVDTSIPSDREALSEAIAEAASLLSTAERPAILAGVEGNRFGIQGELRELVDHTGYPFATTVLGKTVLPERHPHFVGVYLGHLGSEEVWPVVEESDVLLSLGALMTDINLGLWSARLDASRMIVANSDSVRIKHHVYEQVSLSDFVRGLKSELPKGQQGAPEVAMTPASIPEDEYVPEDDRKISIKRFYERLNRFIGNDSLVISDTGDVLFSTPSLFVPEGSHYIAQAFYLSIGFSIPGTLGAKLAAPHLRPITFIGDGAFQMTAQELSTIIRHGLNPIIFLMNNDGYTIERVIHDGAYNDLHMWKYHLLPEAFGEGRGLVVRTEGDLEDALRRAGEAEDSLVFIEVKLDRLDCSDALRRFGEMDKQDE